MELTMMSPRMTFLKENDKITVDNLDNGVLNSNKPYLVTQYKDGLTQELRLDENEVKTFTKTLLEHDWRIENE